MFDAWVKKISRTGHPTLAMRKIWCEAKIVHQIHGAGYGSPYFGQRDQSPEMWRGPCDKDGKPLQLLPLIYPARLQQT